MSFPKIEYTETDSIDGALDNSIDIIEEKPDVSQDDVEYILHENKDNIVAYQIVHIPDESQKNHSIQAATTPLTVNSSANTSVSQQPLQYIVIDGSNGFLQAVPAKQIGHTMTGNASISLESPSFNSNQSNLKIRSSVAIAPKSTPYTITTTNTSQSKPNASLSIVSNAFKKRDDRRRATHNEVERRRRDKINHWIMKLGSIIPADGTSNGIGDSGRLSIAAIEGQSKGGILSKACEYVQMLQDKQNSHGGHTTGSEESRALVEKKKYDDEITRLRGENELLKAILIKHGINYVKERTTFKSSEYS